ncbi:F5/8 type C domain protein [compost metagenome]
MSEAKGGDHQIAIDLGAIHRLRGFVYTPPVQFSDGMMEKGKLQISADGRNWQDAETFEFGNLINDPSPRRYDFKGDVTVRYIRIQSLSIAGNKQSLAIAELDLF